MGFFMQRFRVKFVFVVLCLLLNLNLLYAVADVTYEYHDDKLQAECFTEVYGPCDLTSFRMETIPYKQITSSKSLEAAFPETLYRCLGDFSEGSQLEATVPIKFQRPGEGLIKTIHVKRIFDVKRVVFDVNEAQTQYKVRLAGNSRNTETALSVVFQTRWMPIKEKLRRLSLNTAQDGMFPRHFIAPQTLHVTRETYFLLPDGSEHILHAADIAYAGEAYGVRFSHDRASRKSTPIYCLREYSSKTREFEVVSELSGQPIDHRYLGEHVQAHKKAIEGDECVLSLTTVSKWGKPLGDTYSEVVKREEVKRPIHVEKLFSQEAGTEVEFDVVYLKEGEVPIILGVHQTKKGWSWCCSCCD